MSNTLSTKGRIVAEGMMNDSHNSAQLIYTINSLLQVTDTGLQFEARPENYGGVYVRLVSLKNLDVSDIMKDDEIRTIILNPAPKTPACKEFLDGTTLMGPKEQFIDYDLTSYMPYEIGYGKIHFKKKE